MKNDIIYRIKLQGESKEMGVKREQNRTENSIHKKIACEKLNFFEGYFLFIFRRQKCYLTKETL